MLSAAAQSWGRYCPEFETEPVRLRVAVEEGGSFPPEPAFRGQEHLIVLVSDSAHFAVCDRRTLFAFCTVSSAAVADGPWFRWHFLEAIVYLLLSQRYVLPLHAACVARSGSGVLLCGPSGAGKSTLSFACARAGWTYLGDDASMLLLDSGDRTAIGKPHHFRFRGDAAALFPELAGYRAQPHANSKPTVEVPSTAFPRVSIAARAEVRLLVFLNRQPGSAVNAVSVPPADAAARLLADTPAYDAEVSGRHAEAVARLLEVPAWELRYGRYEEALECLEQLLPRT